MADLGDSITDILLSGSLQKTDPTDIASAMLRAKAGRSSYGEELNRIKAQKIGESNELVKTMTFVMERKQKQEQLTQQAWEKAADAVKDVISSSKVADHPKINMLAPLLERAMPRTGAPPTPFAAAQIARDALSQLDIKAQTKEEVAYSEESGKLRAQAELKKDIPTPEENIMGRVAWHENIANAAAVEGNDRLMKTHISMANMLRERATPAKQLEFQRLKTAHPEMSDGEVWDRLYGMVKVTPGVEGADVTNIMRPDQPTQSAPGASPPITLRTRKDAADVNTKISKMLPMIPALKEKMINAVGLLPNAKRWVGNLFGQFSDEAVDEDVVKAQGSLALAVQQFINLIPAEGEHYKAIRNDLKALMPNPEKWLQAPHDARTQLGQVEDYLKNLYKQNEQILKHQPIEGSPAAPTVAPPTKSKEDLRKKYGLE